MVVGVAVMETEGAVAAEAIVDKTTVAVSNKSLIMFWIFILGAL
jgi:hypothetical protein